MRIEHAPAGLDRKVMAIMTNRDQVLQRITKALGRQKQTVPTIDDLPQSIRERINLRPRSTLPAVADELSEALIKQMEAALMSVVRLQSVGDCASAVDWYLESQNINVSDAQSIRVAPEISSLGWPSLYSSGRASGAEKVSITPCLAAVAETGSIVTRSGVGTPSTLNFLPETHIVLLYESQIVRHVDDVFDLLRKSDQLPRAVNFLTGPSRTADIEQTLEIGAHGPRRMHILLIAGSP
ncbi:MAG: LUD domain-containing protein [Granulosicoccus sp.]|nr:LUD domain-containing protein [Granulosicoccus sp.]